PYMVSAQLAFQPHSSAPGTLLYTMNARPLYETTLTVPVPFHTIPQTTLWLRTPALASMWA
ncbi:MAG: hypothetical protein RSC68_34980, partial [Acinetobacter sp.]